MIHFGDGSYALIELKLECRKDKFGIIGWKSIGSLYLKTIIAK